MQYISYIHYVIVIGLLYTHVLLCIFWCLNRYAYTYDVVGDITVSRHQRFTEEERKKPNSKPTMAFLGLEAFKTA